MPPEPLDPSSCTVRLERAGDLAAAVPHLLGFPPQESLVLVALTGARSARVGVTLRVDLPPPGLEEPAAAQAVDALLQVDPSGAVALVFTEAPDEPGRDVQRHHGPAPGEPWLPGRGLLAEVVGQLAVAGVGVRDCLLVRGGRWWSYDCREPCCAPGAGQPLPGGTSPLAAASAYSGRVLAADRSELVGRLRPVGGADPLAVAAACDRVGAEQAASLAAAGWEQAVETGWGHLLVCLERCGPRSGPLTPDDVARAGWALVDRSVRDRALALATGPDAVSAETLWTQLVRRLPPPLDAEPAVLLAVTAWARGDGTTARAAVDRALAVRPDHGLARAVRSALDTALPPAELRRLLAAACGLPEPLALRAARDDSSPARARGRRGTR